MLSFERPRPFDDARMLFRLFAQLLKELKSLPMPDVATAQRVERMQRMTEDFLAKSQEDGKFNLRRFRAVSDPTNPQEVA